ncbi:aldehyde dehydrogenase [Sphingobium sp. C100]|uniref:aldehyde dehydrogenase family protein n=1 Tax=Sphingobium sp. C100 TaxID=1207055 RepID=UPI0003D6627C|nr:aldehyde dehydrogenase family protein [Sphingobium sp. C100]ETI61179.1 aldehyde dehydrogenase [Sphingobium sp. C100]
MATMAGADTKLVLGETKLYIDGELRPAMGGKTYPNISPWTGEVVGYAADASAEDVEAAIAAARRAFDGTDWSLDKDRRFALVQKLRTLFEENRARLGLIALNEAGAAQGAVNRAHVGMALGAWDDLMGLFPKMAWEQPYEDRVYGPTTHKRIAVKEPIGVVGAITPWNVPLYINVAKVVSALLTGCTVVLKAAPDTPGLAAVFGELADAAGFPAGVLNVITSSDPAMAGEMLTTDPRVDLISFTGSTAVGKRIMANGAPTLKRVFLELGGKSAKIILDDAANFAQEVAHSMLIFHAGQGCAVMSRLLVPRSRYDEAVAILTKAYAAFDAWGDPDAPDHMMGPLISKRQQERVLSYVEIGKQEGARLIAGGNAAPYKGAGFFVEPTCFVDVTNDMRIAREEIFGPVLVVIPFEDDEDAIRIANDSEYGLSGGVYSADVDRALKVARRVRTGTIGINNGMCIAGDIPFGGYKASGIGREWGMEGMEEFLETKLIGIGG